MQMLGSLPRMPEHDTSGGYLDRHIDAALRRACDAAPIVVVDGPRGVGKTTSSLRLAASVVALPDDLPRLEVEADAYLSSLPAPVLVDEWQLAGTELLWTLKRIVDDDPTPGRFLLAGSTEPATYGPTYPLTARSAHVALRPMTVAELSGSGAEPTFLQRVVRGDERPQASAGASSSFDLGLLARPGFPGARHMPDPALFLEGYAALVSQRAGDEGRDATRLMRTMRVLATLEAQAVPDQRVWDAADINKATWKAYEDLLSRTHLAVPSPAFESNRLKRLTTYPKRFLADVAMSLALAGLDLDDLRADPGRAGPYLESFVLQQLRPQVDLLGGTVLHLRTGAGNREVDAIVEVDGRIHAFEVKLGRRPRSSDARHLAWLRDELGDHFASGHVVHTGGDTYPLADRLWALPVELLWQ